MNQSEFEAQIKPFFWMEHESSVSLCLNAGEYRQAIFDARKDEGFEGSGYDWGSLAAVFIAEQAPDLQGIVRFDPEAGMFTAYSKSTG